MENIYIALYENDLIGSSTNKKRLEEYLTENGYTFNYRTGNTRDIFGGNVCSILTTKNIGYPKFAKKGFIIS